MKFIRARVRNGKLTDPKDRHNLDAEITNGSDGKLALVIVFDDSTVDAAYTVRVVENNVRLTFGLPTVAE